MSSPFVPFQSLGSYAADLFRDWRVRRELRRALYRLADEDQDRILRDSGLVAADLDVCLSTAFGSEDLLSRLVSGIGLDPEAIRRSSPAVMRDMERVCLGCRGKRRCRSMLARGEAKRFAEFCPNAGTLAGLIDEPASARPASLLEGRAA